MYPDAFYCNSNGIISLICCVIARVVGEEWAGTIVKRCTVSFSSSSSRDVVEPLCAYSLDFDVNDIRIVHKWTWIWKPNMSALAVKAIVQISKWDWENWDRKLSASARNVVSLDCFSNQTVFEKTGKLRVTSTYCRLFTKWLSLDKNHKRKILLCLNCAFKPKYLHNKMLSTSKMAAIRRLLLFF